MLLTAFVLIVLAAFIGFIVILISSSAIVFSKVTCSLLAALIMVQNDVVFVPNNNFLNYVACAMVCMGIVYLLSTLPRVDLTLRFFCTLLISTMVVVFAVMFIGGVIGSATFEITTPYEILIKTICAAISFGSLIAMGKKESYNSPANIVLKNLERLFAALVYGISIAFLCLSVVNNWELSGTAMLLILLGGTVATFVADIFLAGKDILGHKEEKVDIPR